jgi:hypothetical protein
MHFSWCASKTTATTTFSIHLKHLFFFLGLNIHLIYKTITKNNFISVGIMNDVDSGQSDHYLVYAVFNSEEP